jgi:ring-1,2-phenylacetyl-CoA epoxidase subunit PaaC
MNKQEALLSYTLQMADDALVIGHRLSEWCGHGPILEQDIAITNMALDHLGRARTLYQYAADLFNDLPAETKGAFFTSISLQDIVAKGERVDEDGLAYLRDGWDMRNLLLVEQPNGDWADTITRSFFYDLFHSIYFKALSKSQDETLSAMAEKSLKEVTYHLRWSSEWILRLGDGTEESHRRMQKAIDLLWSYTGELFTASAACKLLLADKVSADPAVLRQEWNDIVQQIFAEATLAIPSDTWMHSGGREGRHSEHLGYVLAELQFVQRAYPGMKW